MKIIIGKKGKRNKIHALSVIVVDKHSAPQRQKQFSILGAASVEDAFAAVLAGTRKELDLPRGRAKK